MTTTTKPRYRYNHFKEEWVLMWRVPLDFYHAPVIPIGAENWCYYTTPIFPEMPSRPEKLCKIVWSNI